MAGVDNRGPAHPRRWNSRNKFTGDRIGLGQYMATCWLEALADLPGSQGSRELHDRMLAWVRGAGGNRSVADLNDLALVLTRMETDTGARTSFDDVLAAFGHTRQSLARLPDDE